MKAPKNCPLCGCSKEWIHVNTYHQGYSFSKAILGHLIFGNSLGPWAGLIGKRKVLYVCRKCSFTMEYNK